MKLYDLDRFEITEDLIPWELEFFCLQGLLQGDFQIEGEETAEDVALDPSFVAMKNRTNLQNAFQIREGPLNLPENRGHTILLLSREK